MKTRYKTTDPIEFTRPAHDNVKDAEWGSRTRVDTTIYPSAQKGVWTLHSRIYDADREWGKPPVANLSESWPNAHASTFEAFLFQHTNKVARMASDYRSDQDREAAKHTR